MANDWLKSRQEREHQYSETAGANCLMSSNGVDKGTLRPQSKEDVMHLRALNPTSSCAMPAILQQTQGYCSLIPAIASGSSPTVCHPEQLMSARSLMSGVHHDESSHDVALYGGQKLSPLEYDHVNSTMLAAHMGTSSNQALAQASSRSLDCNLEQRIIVGVASDTSAIIEDNKPGSSSDGFQHQHATLMLKPLSKETATALLAGAGAGSNSHRHASRSISKVSDGHDREMMHSGMPHGNIPKTLCRPTTPHKDTISFTSSKLSSPPPSWLASASRHDLSPEEREMLYRAAAMQPIGDLNSFRSTGADDKEVDKPKPRRNVRISKDPQSVAARHRRQRISSKMRVLQKLVPGGMKMDTASMLEEAAHYMKFLKAEVEKMEAFEQLMNVAKGQAAQLQVAGSSSSQTIPKSVQTLPHSVANNPAAGPQSSLSCNYAPSVQRISQNYLFRSSLSF